MDPEDDIKIFIKNRLEHHFDNLDYLKNEFLKVNSFKTLSAIDDAFIERKYIKYCAHCFLNRVEISVQLELQSKSHKDAIAFIKDVLNLINTAVALNQFKNLFKDNVYYKNLLEIEDKISADIIEGILSNLKRIYLEEILAYSEHIEFEIKFLYALVDVLFEDADLIEDLSVDEFCCNGGITLSQFLTNILKLELEDDDDFETQINSLKNYAKQLRNLNTEELILFDTYRATLSPFAKPVELIKRNIDNRVVVEVSGIHINVEDVKNEIEQMFLNDSNIEEVRFVGANTLLINADFTDKLWSGKNIVVYVKRIIIDGEITWNVSGKSSEYSYSSKAKTDGSGNGLQGEDGYAGESGGQVLIYCERVENDHDDSFCVISNGGNGGVGQDGGDGKDGEDGVGLTRSQFDEMFPSFIDNSSMFPMYYLGDNVDKTVANIRKISANSDNDWLDDDRNRFMKSTTKDGGKVTFSFCRNRLIRFTRLQGFLVHEGSPGKSGGNGGEPGFGGQGGFPGHIEICAPPHHNIKTISNPGKTGANGRGGNFGYRGKDGWHIGYQNYESWRNQYYCGTDYNQKITIKYYDSNNGIGVRIWCPFKNQYADFITEKIENTERSYAVCAKINSNRQLKSQAVATRKKAIVKSSIIGKYSSLFVSKQNNTLDLLRDNLINTKHDFAAVLIQEEMSRKVAQQIHIKRQLTAPSQKVNKKRKKDKIKHSKNKQPLKENLLSLTQNPFSFDSFLKIKTAPANLLEVEALIKYFKEIDKTSLQTEQINQITQILIDKYFFAKLEKNALEVKPKLQQTDIIDLTAEKSARFLSINKSGNLNVLAILNQALLSHEKLDNKPKTDNSLKFSLGIFIIENCAMKETEPYYQCYREFLTKKQKFLDTIFKIILNDLKRSDTFLNERNLEKAVQNNKFLSSLYTRYHKEVNREYDWTEASKNKALVQIYNKHIKKNGSRSAAFRELIARDFNINLRLYEQNINGHLVVLHNHNPLSKNSVSILFSNDKFILLDLNREYFDLHSERLGLCVNYAEIMNKDVQLEDLKQFSHIKSRLSDADLIKSIILHFDFKDWKMLEERLEALTAKLIGNSNFLQLLSRRFNAESRHIDVPTLCYLIDFVLNLLLNRRDDEFELVLWIIAAFPQRNWIDELLLLKIEDHAKRRIDKKELWRSYLRAVDYKNYLINFAVEIDESFLDLVQILDVFKIMSSIPNEEFYVLKDLKVSEWIYALKNKYWEHQLKLITADWGEDDLEVASYYLLALENSVGFDLVDALIAKLCQKQFGFPRQSKSILPKILLPVYRGEININDLLSLTSVSKDLEKLRKRGDEDRDFRQLIAEIKNNGNTSENVLKQIDTHLQYIDQYHNCTKLKNLEDYKNPYKVIAAITHEIEAKKGIKLRDTQKLTILLSICNEKNLLSQVSTGEGKSLIVVALAIMKALRCERVTVITNSSVLAKRDAERYKDVYEAFGIKVAHNCSEDVEERKKAYNSHHIVYGDLSSFQRDYLLDRFFNKNILGGQSFDTVIVDEVDSMLLDKGNNMLYLSQDIAGLDKLESLYLFIWYRVNRPINDFNDLATILDAKAIKEAVYYDLYGVITKNDLKLLYKDINKSEIDEILHTLINSGIISDQGRLLIEDTSEVKDFDKKYNEQLIFLLKSRLNRNRYIQVPNYLLAFIDQHLDDWIQSAITAFLMKERTDYVVDVDRTNSNPDRNPQIIILDRDTGTDQMNSQWSEALHQFLQLKHGCRLSLQSLKSVFISNVSYFKLYKHLYGLTGTLGSQRERDLLKSIHDVDFVTIPTSRAKKFEEVKPILCGHDDEWLERISETAFQVCNAGRSVLIIAETIEDVDRINQKIRSKPCGDAKIRTYRRDYEDFDIDQLGGRNILIATNLAGRGTDIKITKDVDKCGGLHVIVSYLPDNNRVEQQAFGRCARNGENGTGQLIIRAQRRELNQIVRMKKERDLDELERISKIKDHYDAQISKEEAFLRDFQALYDEISREKFYKEDQKEIILKVCLEKWAFWLDSVGKLLRNKLTQELDLSFREFKKTIKHIGDSDPKEITKSLCDSHPFLMLKYAKLSLKYKDFDNADSLFYLITRREKNFSEAAHYYYSLVYLKERKIGEFKQQLITASKMIERRIDLNRTAYAIIGNIKKNESGSKIQINAYEEQKKGEIEVYSIFKNSIDNILGHYVTPQHITDGSVDLKTANSIYQKLIAHGFLSCTRVSSTLPNLEKICYDFWVPQQDLEQFLHKLRGKKIEEKAFLDDLRKALKLAFREDFWDLMHEIGVFKNPVELVSVDKNKVASDFKLPEIKPVLNTTNLKEIVLYHETIDSSETSIFETKYFKNAIGERIYKELEENETISFNKKAEIDAVKIESVGQLNRFDSLSLSDFKFVKIGDNNAQEILQILIANNTIEKFGDYYKLKASYSDLENFELPQFPIYENAVKLLLHKRFAYRIALQKLQFKIQGNESLQVDLKCNTSSDLMYELFTSKAIETSKIANSADICEKALESLCAGTKVTAKDLSNTLNGFKSQLKSLKSPDFEVKPLREYYNDKNIENLDNFELNAFDDIICLTEERYTKSFWFKTILVAVLGVAQIAIGVALMYFTAGLFPYFGEAFISEGISDLIFAISCARSGHFSWKDYSKYKLESVCITALSFGIGAFFTNSVKISQLAKTSTSAMFKQVAKVTGLRLLQGVAFGVAAQGVDIIVENYMRNLAYSVSTTITSDIDKSVNKSTKFNDATRRAYELLGRDQAKALISKQINSYFDDNSVLKRWLPTCTRAVSSIILQIIAARRNVDNKNAMMIYAKITEIFARIVVTTTEIIRLRDKINNTADELGDLINKKLNDAVKQKVEGDFNAIDCDSFQNQIKDDLKKVLRDKASRVIQAHVFNPLLQTATSVLLRYVGKFIQNKYYSWRDNTIMKEFEFEKEEYKKKMEEIRNSQSEDSQRIEDELTRKYHEKICNLKDKIKSDKLRDAILKEIKTVEIVSTEKEIIKKTSNKLIQYYKELLQGNSLDNLSRDDIDSVINSIKDEKLKQNLRNYFSGLFNNEYFQNISIEDYNKISKIGDILTSNINSEISDQFRELQRVHNKILRINQNALKLPQNDQYLPDYILTKRFLEDNFKSNDNNGDNYEFKKRLNTVASSIVGDTLYLACNYQVNDKNGNETYNWNSQDKESITRDLKSLQNVYNFKKIVFIEPQEAITSRLDNREPHAEMQLRSYFKENSINYDHVMISKAPCANCMSILDNDNVHYKEMAGVNIAPKNWRHPDDIKVKVGASFDFERDFYKAQAFRAPKVHFKREEYKVQGIREYENIYRRLDFDLKGRFNDFDDDDEDDEDDDVPLMYRIDQFYESKRSKLCGRRNSCRF